MVRILVTGATGYVGGRLIPRLLEEGHEVRVLARDPRRIRGRPWVDRVEVVEGDLLAPTTLGPALRGVEVAYYLVHSMRAGPGFEERDRRAAMHFAYAAQDLDKVVYLGGLVPKVASRHLRSREEVGVVLRSLVPTTELRAGPVIGAGSASFEMVRHLTERFPVLIVPRWVRNEVQPIAVADLLAYLVEALDHEALGVVEIGAERIRFEEMFRIYAEVRGLVRWIATAPALPPRLSARWVERATPIPKALARPLIEGIVHSVTADTRRASARFPRIRPKSYREAVERALRGIRGGRAMARWSDVPPVRVGAG